MSYCKDSYYLCEVDKLHIKVVKMDFRSVFCRYNMDLVYDRPKPGYPGKISVMLNDKKL